MANKYYDPGQQRAAKVQDLFSRIAARYDLINDLQSFGLHRYWKRYLCRMAQVRPGDAALDVCCGTGDIALLLAQRAKEVVGVDFNAPMLDVARERAKASPTRIQFLQGDALHLPFEANYFDVVTIGYGLRNLSDFQAGLSEMLRVTRPGGRILVLDFGKPTHPLLRAGYFVYLRHWVPLFGRLLCGDAATHAYILESLENYPAQEGIRTMMEELQCRQVRVINLLGGIMSINYGEKTD